MNASGNLTDLEGAKTVARRIFNQYDKNKTGQINQTDTIPMIVEAYKSFSYQYNPQTQDVNAYHKILDRNGDGIVTYEDIEQTCIRYLCPNIQSQQQNSAPAQEQQKHAGRHLTQSNAPLKSNEEARQKLELAISLFKKYDTNQNGFLEYQEIGALLKEFYQLAGMGYAPTNSDIDLWIRGIDSDDSGTIDIQEFVEFLKGALRRGGYNTDGLYFDLPVINQQEKQKHAAIRSNKKQSPEKPAEFVRYTQQAKRHLDVADRLFARFDTDNSGFLESSEVSELLKATYQEMGMPNYNPSPEDVKVWIRMTDVNMDGKISLDEYRTVVLNSLRKAGFQVEEIDGQQSISVRKF